MVSETILAALTALIVPTLGFLAWAVRRAFHTLVGRVERSVEQSVQATLEESAAARREEHRRVWQGMLANYELSRGIAEALKNSNGALEDTDVDIPDHPYELRHDRTEDDG